MRFWGRKTEQKYRIAFEGPDMVHSTSYNNIRVWRKRNDDVGTMQVADGVTWNWTITIMHDGNGNLLQTPRTITLKMKVVKDD